MKKFFDAVIQPASDELQLISDEWELWKLVQKYHSHDRGTCVRDDCLICASIQKLDRSQYELACMHEGRAFYDQDGVAF